MKNAISFGCLDEVLEKWTKWVNRKEYAWDTVDTKMGLWNKEWGKDIWLVKIEDKGQGLT